MYEQTIARLRNAQPQELQSLAPTSAALTLWALPQDERLARLRQQLIALLQKQLSDAWLQNGPAPAVFTAVAALASQKPRAIPAQQLAIAVRRLVAAEVSVGGPYAFGGEPAYSTNAVIACLVAEIAKPLPQLATYLNSRPTASDPHFSPLALRYICNKAAVSQVPAPLPAPWRGSWKAEQLVHGEPPSAIATAAIALALHMQQQPVTGPHLAVLQQVKNWFAGFEPPIARPAANLLAHIAHADTSHEITLTSHFFAESLQHPPQLDTRHIVNLDAATACGWMAYMAYDTFLDGSGKQAHLPVANIALRLATATFQSVAAHTPKPPDILAILGTMDRANAWELTHTRLAVHDGLLALNKIPTYKSSLQLADRSIAHTLGSRIILAATAATQQQTDAVASALQHYLAARQLSDDLRDWAEDLRSGQVSFVVSALLQKTNIPAGSYRLDALMRQLQPTFTSAIVPYICDLIIWHLDTAAHLLSSTKLFKPHNKIELQIMQLRTTAQQSREAQGQRTAFMRAYAKKPRDPQDNNAVQTHQAITT